MKLIGPYEIFRLLCDLAVFWRKQLRAIRDAVLQHFKDIGHHPEEHSVTYENAQARERTQVLMDNLPSSVRSRRLLAEAAPGLQVYPAHHTGSPAAPDSVDEGA